MLGLRSCAIAFGRKLFSRTSPLSMAPHTTGEEDADATMAPAAAAPPRRAAFGARTLRFAALAVSTLGLVMILTSAGVTQASADSCAFYKDAGITEGFNLDPYPQAIGGQSTTASGTIYCTMEGVIGTGDRWIDLTTGDGQTIDRVPKSEIQCLDSGCTFYSWSHAVPFPQGTYTVHAHFEAQNEWDATVQWADSTNDQSYTVGPPPTTPTVQLTPDPPNSATFGQTVTLTATLSGLNGQNADGGRVDFDDHGNLIAPGTIHNGQAQIQSNSLAVGSHSLQAHYEGGAGGELNPADSNTVQYTVNPAPTAPTLTLNVPPPNPSTRGDSVPMTATLDPSTLNGQTADGTADFYDGATKLNDQPVTVTNGSAPFSTVALTVGSHTLKAHYNGNSSGTLSAVDSSGVSHTVNQVKPTLSLSVSPPSPQTVGTQVTMTATFVFSSLHGMIIDTENVNFYDTISQKVVAHGTIHTADNVTTAVSSPTALAAGSYNLQAQYAGDANVAAANSTNTIPYIIKANAVTPKLTLDVKPPSPNIRGDVVTMTATLDPSSLNGQTADGTADFYDGTTKLNTQPVTVSNGKAQYNPDLQVGTHTLKAHYNGNSAKTLNATDSNIVSNYIVNKAPAALSLGVSPASPQTVGTQVTMTATFVFSSLHGMKIDGQNVNFYDTISQKVVAPGTIHTANNVTTAVSAPTALAAGSYNLQAQYAGDANVAAANSTNTVPYTINPNQVATATTLTISAGGAQTASVAAGTAVTLSAKVATTGGSPSPVTPGTVNFCEAAAKLCTDINRVGSAQLNASGVAQIVLFPPIGTYQYKAVFVAHTGYATSSDTKPLMVTGKYNTQTTLNKPAGTGPYTLTATVAGIAPPSPKPSPAGTVDFLDTNNQSYALAHAPLSGTPVDTLNVNKQSLTAGQQPYSEAAGDFNGDGYQDIAVANLEDSTILIYFGGKSGLTPAPNPVRTNLSPYPIVTGDFDNDGNVDIVVGDALNITFFHNDGHGGFADWGTDTRLKTGNAILGLVAGDFDNDGSLDLAVMLDVGTQIYHGIGKGNGSPQFSPIGTPVPPGSTYAYNFVHTYAAAGDFNNDGKLDLIVPDGANNGFAWVLLGQGDGTFQANPGAKIPVPSAAYNPQSAAVADFDGDGNLDVALGIFNSTSASGVVNLYKGDGHGNSFTQQSIQPPLTVGSRTNLSIAVGDFNGDGIADIVSAGSDNIYYNGDAFVNIWPGTGAWQFSPRITYQPDGGNPQATIIGDFNGDGFTDLAVANEVSNKASVSFMQPTATLTATATNVPAPVGPSSTTHNVVAHYEGNTSFNPSDSGPQGLKAEPLPTTLTLVPDPLAGSQQGEQVKLTATLAITGDPQGHDVKNENVTFYSNGQQIGDPQPLTALSGGKAQAILLTKALPVGTDSLTAKYVSDGNFASATSNTVRYPVQPNAATNVVITLCPVSGGYAMAPLTLTALASPPQAYSAIEGDTVTFTRVYTGGPQDSSKPQLLGTGTWANGQATFTVPVKKLVPGVVNEIQANSSDPSGKVAFVPATNNYFMAVPVSSDQKASAAKPKVYLQSKDDTPCAGISFGAAPPPPGAKHRTHGAAPRH
jgi:hypothetical protein